MTKYFDEYTSTSCPDIQNSENKVENEKQDYTIAEIYEMLGNGEYYNDNYVCYIYYMLKGDHERAQEYKDEIDKENNILIKKLNYMKKNKIEK
jgi:hypothetical protein